MALLKSKWLHGLHEGHEANGLLHYLDKPSWIVFTEEVGADPNNKSGKDFREWTKKGFWPIVRINHGYEPNGTLPPPNQYSDFAKRVGNYVAASQGPVYYWIIGNEPNLKVERPKGIPISASDAALCYLACRKMIKSIPGHEGDVVMPPPVGPWNDETGHWIDYFLRMMREVEGNCDGIALHTYTHGHTPDLIFSDQRMQPPNQHLKYQFRAYEDFLAVVPSSMRSLPVFLTEVTQVKATPDDYNGWANERSGYVVNLHTQVDKWNMNPKNQTIQGVVLYRWPKRDAWSIEDKSWVITDFQLVVRMGFMSPEPNAFPKQDPIPAPTDTTPLGKPIATGTVVALILNVRNAPGIKDTQVIDKLSVGTPVTIYAERNVEGSSWYLIGQGRWVASHLVNKDVVTTEPKTPDEKWRRCLDFVIRWEGGYQNFDWDPGNWTGSKAGEGTNLGTKYGISGHSYPNLDIKNLTKEQAIEIYYRDYYAASGADKLSWPYCLLVFNAAVNFGTDTARTWVSQHPASAVGFLAEQLEGYRHSDAWRQAGDAWVDRTVNIMKEFAKYE